MMKQCLTILFIVGGVGLTPLSLLADASQRWHDPVKDLSNDSGDLRSPGP